MKRDNYIVTRNDLNDMLLKNGGGTSKWDWGSDGNRGATKEIMLTAYESRAVGDVVNYPSNRLIRYQDVQSASIPCIQVYDYFVGYQTGECSSAQDELRSCLIFFADGAGNFLNEISRDLPSFTVDIFTQPYNGYGYTTTLTIDPGTLGDSNSFYDTYPWKIYYYQRRYHADPYSGTCLGYDVETIAQIDGAGNYCSGGSLTSFPIVSTPNPIFQETWATSLQGGLVPTSVTPNPANNVYLRYFPPTVNGQKWYVQLPAGFYIKDWSIRNMFGTVIASGASAQNGELDLCYYLQENTAGQFISYKVFITGTDVQIRNYSNIQLLAQYFPWACGDAEFYSSSFSFWVNFTNTMSGTVTVPYYGMTILASQIAMPVWSGGIELGPYETINQVVVSGNFASNSANSVPMLVTPMGVTSTVTGNPVGYYSALSIVATTREGATLDSGGWIYFSAGPHGSNGFRRITTAGQRIWEAVVKSADARVVIGSYFVSPGVYSLLRSTDYGVTWSQLAIGGSGGGKLAMSSSGKYVYLLDAQNYPIEMGVWVSSDYGASFTRTLYFNGAYCAETGSLVDVRCSNNGQHVTFITEGSVFRSQDWGANWANPVAMGITSVNFVSLTVSGDGRYQIASKGAADSPESSYNLWRSTNYGYNWNFYASSNWKPFYSISSSDDGRYMIASEWAASGVAVKIWISSSYGKTWTEYQSLPANYASRYVVMMSPTGQYCVVLPYEGQANYTGSTYAAYYDFTFRRSPLAILPSSNNSIFRTVRAQYASAGYR
jgi:hypothetical protein